MAKSELLTLLAARNAQSKATKQVVRVERYSTYRLYLDFVDQGPTSLAEMAKQTGLAADIMAAHLKWLETDEEGKNRAVVTVLEASENPDESIIEINSVKGFREQYLAAIKDGSVRVSKNLTR